MDMIADLAQQWLKGLGAFALGKVLPAVLLLLAGMMVIRIVMRLIQTALNKSKLEKAAHTLIQSVVRVALYIFLVLIVASALGIDVSGIVALASVLTLAISLSVQNALSNVIGGFQLLTTKPFASGDFVEIAGQSGTVKEIGLTYTKLATADNKLVSSPNSSVTAAQIVNYSVTGKRRVTVTVSAAYSSPVEQVLEALRQAGNVPTALKDPAPFAAVDSYDDSCIRYIVHIWCNADDYWTTQFEANKNVKAVFDEKGIAMTYPHLNVHLDK